MWLYPVGWADVGYSPAEVAIKEVLEETGIEVEVASLIAVFDGLRLGFARLPMYSLVFHCRMIGGELQGHPLETRDVGFFARDALPWPLAGGARWVDTAFAAIDGEQRPVDFDAPRTPPWRGDVAHPPTGCVSHPLCGVRTHRRSQLGVELVHPEERVAARRRSRRARRGRRPRGR